MATFITLAAILYKSCQTCLLKCTASTLISALVFFRRSLSQVSILLFQVREGAYKYFMSENREQQSHLDNLLRGRHMLARLVGFDTYAQRALCGTMAETPGNLRFVQSVLFCVLHTVHTILP